MGDTDQTTLLQGNYTSSSPTSAVCLQTPSDSKNANSEDESGAIVDSLSVASFPQNGREHDNTPEQNRLLDNTGWSKSFNSFSPSELALQNLELTEDSYSTQGTAQGPGNVFLNCFFFVNNDLF